MRDLSPVGLDYMAEDVMADRRSDGELVRAARAGSQEAFGELVARYKDALFGIAFHRLGDFEEARDAAQDALVKVYLTLPRLRNPAAFGNWVCRIADGTARDAARRPRREVPLEQDLQAPSQVASPQVAAERAELSAQVSKALQSLSERTRLAVILHYVNGYSHAEVASFIGATSAAVKTRISRAKSRLREEMMEVVERTLKHRPSRFVYEATDAQGRVISGVSEASSASELRRRLSSGGYRVLRLRQDRRTSEELKAEAGEAPKRLAETILEQALADNAETITIAVTTTDGRDHVTVTYRIAGKRHEAMQMPAYCWASLREHLAEMAGLKLREGARRQAGDIRVRLRRKDHQFAAVLTARRIEIRPSLSDGGC